MESGEVMELEVLDYWQEEQEENNERRKLAAVVDVEERIYSKQKV